MSVKKTKQDEHIAELTADLQRLRADFENYRKRVDQEKASAQSTGEARMIIKLLPIVDTIERAISHTPAELADNPWVQGIAALTKSLDTALGGMNVLRIDARPGTVFDPDVHHAVQFDEDAEGDVEVIAEELQAGYILNGSPVREAMVKVTRK
ncbi:nucleotide exchange factor GrpE [Candidatus Saccharibacteria bacterium]|nr:MAG: nucleotide exchange factor GrpE [Candidatus Saccharibacteria bacterium]